MDRLTHINKGMAWYKSDLLLLEPSEMSHSQISEVLHRLAAYEETGLTPEEIKTITSTTELHINNTLTRAEVEELMGTLKQQPGTLCVCCGEYVPEGRQVYPACETEAGL